MADAPSAAGLGYTATNYTGSGVLVGPVGPNWVLVLPADPNRWYVRFAPAVGPSMNVAVRPGPPPGTGAAAGEVGPEWEVKFRDAPALCTGEWYAAGNAPGSVYIYTERYKGA